MRCSSIDRNEHHEGTRVVFLKITEIYVIIDVITIKNSAWMSLKSF